MTPLPKAGQSRALAGVPRALEARSRRVSCACVCVCARATGQAAARDPRAPEPRRRRAERRPEAKLRCQTKSATPKPGEAAGEAHLDTRKLVVWLIWAGKHRSRRNTAAGGGEWRRNVAGAREEGGVARTEDSGVLRVVSDSSWATEGARALTATRRGSPAPRTMVAAV